MSTIERSVYIPPAGLQGDLTLPDGARGLVLFAHGSGSSRHSRRNRAVARALNNGGLATLLIDLLTPDEEQEDLRSSHLRFDIGLLAQRLLETADWLSQDETASSLRTGLFGASTGGGAALAAAAQWPEAFHAVVSRGGRPDLAGPALPLVKAPTLLIVGSLDEPVIELNEQAYSQLRCEKRLSILPGASHLFEEPGKLEEVAVLAQEWFTRWLSARSPTM